MFKKDANCIDQGVSVCLNEAHIAKVSADLRKDTYSTPAKYEPPSLTWFPAEELNTIVSSMSGGSGGGIQLKWDDYWVDSGSEGDYSLEVSVVASLLCLILTKNWALSEQVTATVVTNIACDIVNRQLDVIYYERRVRHLYMLDGYTSEGPVWSLLGSAVKTNYYGNSSHSDFLGTLDWNNISSEFAYALASLTW